MEEEAEVVAGGGPKKGKVYTHSTQATDTDQIEKIFSGVKKTIMANVGLPRSPGLSAWRACFSRFKNPTMHVSREVPCPTYHLDL